MHGPYNERFTARRTSTSRRLPRVLVPRHGKRIPQPSQSGKIRQCFQWSFKKRGCIFMPEPRILDVTHQMLITPRGIHPPKQMMSITYFPLFPQNL